MAAMIGFSAPSIFLVRACPILAISRPSSGLLMLAIWFISAPAMKACWPPPVMTMALTSSLARSSSRASFNSVTVAVLSTFMGG